MTTDSTAVARVTHRFTVNPERVFDAWLNPDTLWRWGARLDEVVRVEIDPRVGGRFSFVVRRDGEDLDHNGEYLEIDRPRRLVFTWYAGDDDAGLSRVTIDIAPTEAGCELSLIHEMDARWADYVDRTEHGWATILAAIDAETTENG